MEWLKVGSVEELKALGKFIEVKRIIEDDIKEITFKNDIRDFININSISWHELYNKIEFIRRIVCGINREFKGVTCTCPDCLEEENNKNKEEFYKSEAHEYIFYLLKLTGSERDRKLSIKRSYYVDNEKALKWYREIAKKIHPSCVDVYGADRAIVELAKLYNEMTS